MNNCSHLDYIISKIFCTHYKVGTKCNIFVESSYSIKGQDCLISRFKGYLIQQLRMLVFTFLSFGLYGVHANITIQIISK